ncbi:hypothetical protein WJX84_003049 [Apatococcus fuscideae]|uniref:Uncharacterized protein n=1 Tax=Apatococcus fuscideae TaxID=2026836 RepID=A0AAW1S7X2_9CHLO
MPPFYWSDDEEDQPSFTFPQPGTSRLAVQKPPRQKLGPPRRQQKSIRTYGPPALEAICLGCLAEYMPELLEAGDAVLPHLPPPTKLSLLTVARSQGLLDGRALGLLADGEWLRLDLAGCKEVDDAGLQAALPSLSSLQALDLTDCPAAAPTLRLLPTTCPHLTLLRLG